MEHSNYRVIVGSSAWQLNGVNIFAEHLVRGLRNRGVDAHILFTEQDTWLVQLPKEMMPFPKDIPSTSLPTAHQATWEAHWYATIKYLESLAPCIYFPNSDFRHSCVTPLLPDNVTVVGLIQGDDPIHYEHVHRLGAYWDAIVCVSDEIADKVGRLDPEFKPRIHAIPNTVVVPEECPHRERAIGSPLRIVYHGVLNTYQKRILNIADILTELERRKIPFHMTLAGDGPQKSELLGRCEKWLSSGEMEYKGIVAHHDVDAMLREADAYVMTSAFEGMPHALLEAMAQGCVPVVTDIDSGIPELVTQGKSGFRNPIGDIKAFADRFTELQQNVALCDEMSKEAHRSIKESRFNVEAMIDAYLELFPKIVHSSPEKTYRRPRGTILPPPAIVNGLSIFPCETAGFIEDVHRMLNGRKSPASGSAPARPKGLLSKIWHKIKPR